MSGRYSMEDAAKKIGVHRLTLYRWEREGKIPPPKRYVRNKYRVYLDEDIERIIAWRDSIVDPSEAVSLPANVKRA